jgi:hypothetical protein
MIETELQKLLLLAAPAALPNVRLFRRNTGVATYGERKVKFGIKGQCDLYGLLRGGQHLEIELKSATGSLSLDQQRWRDFCVKWGVTYLLLRAISNETPKQTVARWIAELGALFWQARGSEHGG